MSVIALTVFLSLILATFFAVLFFTDRKRSQLSSLERDALLPFDDEEAPPRAADQGKKSPKDLRN